MISGRAKATVVAVLASACAWAQAPRDEVDALLAALAREPPQTIAFLEVRSSPLLARELSLEGSLEYLGPGKLSRVVSAPYAEQTIIDGDAVRIRRGNRAERRFSLSRAPGLGGFLAGLAAILSGDRGTLEHEFEISMAGAAQDWQLTLVPRSHELRERVGSIRLRGAAGSTRCVVTAGPAGETVAELLLGEAAARGRDASWRALNCGSLP